MYERGPAPDGTTNPVDCALPADGLTWEAPIALWKSAVVLRQLVIALAIAMGLVWALGMVLLAVDGDMDGASVWVLTRTMLAIFLGLFAGAWLITFTLYRRYEHRYTLDARGVTAATVGATRRTNAMVNALLMLSGRPAAMGGGMLAAARQAETIAWDAVDDARADDHRFQILMRGGGRTLMLIQCTPANYALVSQAIDARLAHSASRR